MTQSDERRVQGVNRVPVSTLVEICGNDPGIPAFEAESVDVSGRGMHVRTAYLPDEGAPLVCRFEDQGREIVVEGVVAWRREGARGGEFGIQFTALDSSSVDALKDLCGTAAPPAPMAADTEPSPDAPGADTGARVRLHIDGLGSPMKARVRDGGTRKVQVGSNLEFLKVGRHVDIEDLERGGKRGAIIDAVDVVIDPGSQVPQLVVALRFDDAEESTPEPSVIDAAPVEDMDDDEAMFAAPSPAGSAGSDDDVDEMMDDAGAFKTKLGGAADKAGAAARTAGAGLARAGGVAAAGLGKLLKGASAKVGELREKRAAAGAPKRTTAPPPSSVLQGARLRPQSSSQADIDAEVPATPAWKKPGAKKAAAGAGAAVLLLTVVALAMHKPKAPPGAEAVPAAKTVAVAGDVTKVDDQGNPLAAASAAAPAPGKTLSNAAETAANAKQGVTADVPLFGPTPMATMEPAPLGSAPDQQADDPPDPGAAPAGSAAAPETEEQKEMEAANAVPDQTFPDTPSSTKKNVKPGDVHPWGCGKVHTPTVHRIRLDGPGGAIEGVVKATGFTVVIPGRKVMESAGAIPKRDKRIARVQTENTAGGAQITFQFKDGVPGYRVRLRKDYVEFLISAPGKGDGVSSMKDETHATKHHHHKKGAKAESASTKKHAKHHHKKHTK